MSSLSSDLLLRAQRNLGNEPFLKEVRKSIIKNQQKISRQVYNADSRNMKKFAQQLAAFQNKFKTTKQSGFVSKSLPIKKGDAKYQENQLLQLTFEGQFKPKQDGRVVNDNISALTIRNSSNDGSSNRNVTFKTALNHRFSFRMNYVENSKSKTKGLGARQKSNSFAKEDRLTLRKRVITQWEHSPNKESLSRLSVQKAQQSSNPNIQYHVTDDYIIDVTRDKMNKFIRTLHRLEWAYHFVKDNTSQNVELSRQYQNHMKTFQYDADCPINEQAINYMISRRYHLHSSYLQDVYQQRARKLKEQSTSLERKKLADSSQFPLLSSLSKHSVLHLLQKHLQNSRQGKYSSTPQRQENAAEVYFSLPYSEFISHRETKNSIYQLVGMNAKLGLKLAFTIFDKNRNGFIDEDDLLQLISLSRDLPTLQIDIATLSRGMLTFKQSRKPFFQKPKLTRGDSIEFRLKDAREKSLTIGSRQSQDPSQILPIEEQKGSDSQESQFNQKSLSTSRFSIDKLYIFLKDKQKNNRSTRKIEGTNLQPLNWASFCKAFQYKRPYIIYDLFQFIFDASIEDFKEPIQKEINRHLSKLQRSNSITEHKQQEQTLEEKWNKRLKFSNSILRSFIRDKQQQ